MFKCVNAIAVVDVSQLISAEDFKSFANLAEFVVNLSKTVRVLFGMVSESQFAESNSNLLKTSVSRYV